MSYVDAILYGAGGNGGGGISPADAVLVTPQSLSAAQQTQARENIGSEAAARLIPVAGQEVRIVPEHNCVYQCGVLRALTIAQSPAQGSYTVLFTSGNSAATSSVPEEILGLEDFSAKQNTLYEINVRDNRAVVGSWAVTVNE